MKKEELTALGMTDEQAEKVLDMQIPLNRPMRKCLNSLTQIPKSWKAVLKSLTTSIIRES